MKDTIAAIATSQLPAGIGVLRISGPAAIETAEAIFSARSGQLISEKAGYTALFGKVHIGTETIDECVALVFRAPHSYTGEDVVELSCHGGSYIMQRVLAAATSAGARLADPGEFTLRAFLNQKLDLTQAEAVMDIIGAQGKTAARAAVRQHEGALFRKILELKAMLVEISADITAWVDFPDEGVPALEPQALKTSLEIVGMSIDSFIKNYEHGRILREGIETAIVGKPNVGKSTLMNAIAGFEKSIVTQVAGTTRDVVEESVNFAGIVLRLFDTAGLRETRDLVESIGVSRAREKLESSQLIFAVFDASSILDYEDFKVLDMLEAKNVIAVLNKCDLPTKIDEKYIISKVSRVVKLSAVKGEGFESLEASVRKFVQTDDFDPNEVFLSNQRQLLCVKNAGDGIKLALEAVESGITLDAVSVGVEQAISALCELTGERASDEVIDRVFSKFCIGK